MHQTAASNGQVPWEHHPWPASPQSGQDLTAPHQQLKVGAKRMSPSSCSSASSSHNNMQQESSQTGKPNIAHHRSKRRRSRARPSPPITHISALDKAHFKSLVHHFTGMGASLNHSLLPPLSPFYVRSHSPCSPPTAPAPASLAIAQSLKSTLHILFACLKLLHGSTSPSPPAFPISHAELELCISKALALLQALDRSQPINALMTTSRSPQIFPGVAAPEPATNLVESQATYLIEPEANNVSTPMFVCHDIFLTTSHCDDHPNHTLKENHENSISTRDSSTLNDRQHAQLALAQHSPFQQDCTTSQENVQPSWLQHQSKELERFLLEGNNKVDDLFSRDSFLFTHIASQCGLLASN